jgi:hypothetical protein
MMLYCFRGLKGTSSLFSALCMCAVFACHVSQKFVGWPFWCIDYKFLSFEMVSCSGSRVVYHAFVFMSQDRHFFQDWWERQENKGPVTGLLCLQALFVYKVFLGFLKCRVLLVQ